jgi:hypothetical protein
MTIKNIKVYNRIENCLYFKNVWYDIDISYINLSEMISNVNTKLKNYIINKKNGEKSL